MSGSTGRPARSPAPVYAAPDDFVGPLRPGEVAPEPVSLASQWRRQWKDREAGGTTRVYDAVVEPVIAPVKKAAASVGSSLKSFVVYAAFAALAILAVLFFLRGFAGGLARGKA